MMRFRSIFVLFFYLTSTAVAAEIPGESLFLTPQEARTAEILADKNAPAGQGDIRLGAVMYYGPGDWALWLQGERWTPETRRENLSVTQVTAGEVHMIWRGDEGGKEHEIVLRPNQTYQIATGKVMGSP